MSAATHGLAEHPFWQALLMPIGHLAFLVALVALLDWLLSIHTDKADFALVVAGVALVRTYNFRVVKSAKATTPLVMGEGE